MTHLNRAEVVMVSGRCSCIYTCLKKRRVKRVNDGQCDTMELWEDGTGKFVTGFCFLMFKILSFQDNLKSKLRHAEL